MPLLAGWLTSLFSGMTAFFLQWMTLKASFAAAGLVVFTAMVGTLYAALAALAAGLASAFPSVIGTIIWLVVPDNIAAIMAAYIAADTVLSLFFWHQVNLNLAMRGAV